MGELTIRGKFEPSKVQSELLEAHKIELRHEFVPQVEKTYAHWKTQFKWEGKEKPLTQDILCYEDDTDPYATPLPKELARKSVKRQTMNHTTEGLSGSKD